ncbi:MAG: 3-oxoacyl-[acyl-carrier-protein] synthase III C-terminal domain-containing protein [Roseateles sp.]|uniref:3-oxoacyl-[acyl-carrier-protein] synthase III C-terminal domain-containing protein n=1 Tax=Roseateles sp. TaxID=1971397 RepID=UPI0039EB56A9
MKASFTGVSIAACIGVVPRQISYFDDEIENYSHDKASSIKLKELMGYGEHRVAPAGVTTADLAQTGFSHLIERGTLKTDEIDAVYFVSQTPDYVIPPTSAALHGRLGLQAGAYCADINEGCNGFIKGLFEACAFLSATDAHCAVILAGDVLSQRVSSRDRNSYPLIGDAATVTVLRKDAAASPINIEIRHDGAGFDKLIIPAGGARRPSCAATSQMEMDGEGNWRSQEQLRMNGRDVFAFTQTVVPQFLDAFIRDRGTTFSDYQRLYFHQANAFIIDRLRKKFGVNETAMPDRVVRRYGNSSSATIPMLIASEPDTSSSLHCLLSGFGVGLSWGAADIVLKPCISMGVIEQ